MYNILEEFIEHTHNKENLIITEDFNAVFGNKANGNVIGKYGLGKKMREGAA